jgi:hypothetical protein
LASARSRVRERWREHHELVAFALAAALVPLLLFTFAGNIIFPYALPALPFVALALAALVGDDPRVVPRLAAGALATVVVVAIAAWAARSYMETHSQRVVIDAVARGQGAKAPIYYWQTRFFSAEYYGQGRARVARDAAPLARELAAHGEFTLVVPEKRVESLPADISRQLEPGGAVDEMRLFVPDYSARPVAAQ